MITTPKTNNRLNFILPPDLACSKPTEDRGMRRDEVNLMVSNHLTDEVHHSQFHQLADFLNEGDVLVVNTSGTLSAALPTQKGELEMGVHLSTRLASRRWVVELRQMIDGQSHRYTSGQQGESYPLPDGAVLQLLAPYSSPTPSGEQRLWEASLKGTGELAAYLTKYGSPIRYGYLKKEYPISYYQTVFAREAGSAEMPSAGRAFTPELVLELINKGVEIVPILLHTGVASLEADERPYAEYFRVSEAAADRIRQAKSAGRRIIAVGTTVVRALESAINDEGFTQAAEGWTEIFIEPARGLAVVDGLLTGFHEPNASHLLMLESLAGRGHLELTYQEALDKRYHWHEFGDLHLIL